MCAINGFTFQDADLVRKMNAVTKHRGPDASDVLVLPDISLGHNRLSIIDLSPEANQPMKSADGRYVIVFNGEIYNFQDIKKELGGYPFKTKSDTEVVLAAYNKWGKDCVKRFNGIFAFAIWDTKGKELLFARDHIGVKPFYYFNDGRRFIFSSEVKAILEHGIQRRLNLEAFNHYLRVLYVPEPLTMFEGVFKLPSAHYGTFKNGALKIARYWSSPQRREKLPFKKAEELFLERLQESVRKQLISDRPVGIFLSGGIDSSAVLDSVSRIHPQDKIDTFSVGFTLDSKEEAEKFNADFNLARRTARHYGTNHHEVLVEPEEVTGLFEQAIWHLDEPISNPTVIPMLKIARYAKEKVAVVLTGDGGDELFGGYERHRLSLCSSYYRRLPKFLRIIADLHPSVRKLDTAPGIERFSQFMFQKDEILKEAVADGYFSKKSFDFFRNKYFAGQGLADFETAFIRTDRQSWLVDESLMKTDKTSMAAGLETRVPLLDPEMVLFAEGLPREYKVTLNKTKVLPRSALHGRLPEFLLDQPKRGWFSPAAKWLRYPDIYEYAQKVLSSGFYEPTAHLFNWPAIARILEDHRTKKRYNATLIWSILTFQLWAKIYQVKL